MMETQQLQVAGQQAANVAVVSEQRDGEHVMSATVHIRRSWRWTASLSGMLAAGVVAAIVVVTPFGGARGVTPRETNDAVVAERARDTSAIGAATEQYRAGYGSTGAASESQALAAATEQYAASYDALVFAEDQAVARSTEQYSTAYGQGAVAVLGAGGVSTATGQYRAAYDVHGAVTSAPAVAAATAHYQGIYGAGTVARPEAIKAATSQYRTAYDILSSKGGTVMTMSENTSDEQTTTVTMDDVEVVHTRWWTALLAGDMAAVETLLADDVTFHTPFGTTQTKAGEVEALRWGQVSYTSVKDEEPVIRLHGQTGIVTGRADIEYQAGGQAGQARVYYTAVYGWTAPHWHMLAWQATLRAEQ